MDRHDPDGPRQMVEPRAAAGATAWSAIGSNANLLHDDRIRFPCATATSDQLARVQGDPDGSAHDFGWTYLRTASHRPVLGEPVGRLLCRTVERLRAAGDLPARTRRGGIGARPGNRAHG